MWQLATLESFLAPLERAPLLLPGVLPRARPREGVGHVVHGGGPLAEVEAVHAVDPWGRGTGAVVVVVQGLAAPEKGGQWD